MKKKSIIKFSIACFAVFVMANLAIRFVSNPPQNKIDEAVAYAKSHGLRTDCVVLMDFSTHSGKPRFWVYDVDNEKVLLKSLCSHGCGEGNTMSKPKLSNVIGSKCSSKGIYRIEGYHLMTKAPIGSLRLTGLSSTNSNAASRGILIHPGGFSTIFGLGAFPFYLPLTIESEGCFAINYFTFNSLTSLTKQSSKKMLLYAYE